MSMGQPPPCPTQDGASQRISGGNTGQTTKLPRERTSKKRGRKGAATRANQVRESKIKKDRNEYLTYENLAKVL